jgi:Na+/alanine symporter
VAPIFNDSINCVITVSSVVSDIIAKYSSCPSRSTMILRYYPEIIDYYNSQSKNQAKKSLMVSQVFTTTIFSEHIESFFTGFLSLAIVFLAWVLFLSLYYSPYSNVNESESIIDQEYLAVSKLTEGEKEIGSVDDLLLPILMLVYIFG